MLNQLPKRFKEIKKEDLIKLRKNRSFFLLYMLWGIILKGIGLSLLKSPEFSQYCKITLEHFTILGLIIHLLFITGICLIVMSIIFLYKLCNAIYCESYKDGNVCAYAVSFFVPFGGLIFLVVVLNAFFDVKKVLNLAVAK